MSIVDWVKRNASTILTCLGAGGMVATVALAIKATPRAYFDVVDARITKSKDEPHDLHLTPIEVVQSCWEEYIPAAAVGVGSLACIFGANVLNRRQQASLASACTALTATYEAYKDKIKLLCGPGTDAIAEKAVEQERTDEDNGMPPWDAVQAFYIEGHPKFFERTMEQVLQAEYYLNRNFILRGKVMLNELFDLLDLPHTEEGEHIGWNEYDGETTYGYRWIDFNHQYYLTDDGMMVCTIQMPFPPHPFDEAE